MIVFRRPLFLILALSALMACSKKADSGNQPDTVAASLRYVQAQGGLRMRAEPNPDAAQIGLIPNGAQVTLHEESGDVGTIGGRSGRWTRVGYADQSGWVFGGFLTTEPDLTRCLPLTPQTLGSFQGGCLGKSCPDRQEPYGKIFFQPGGRFVAAFDVRDEVGGLTWRVEGKSLIAEGNSGRHLGQECGFTCQAVGTDQIEGCNRNCTEGVRERYGKLEATYSVRYEYRIQADGSFKSSMWGGDGEPVPGKDVIRDHHEHEGRDIGCMYPLS